LTFGATLLHRMPLLPISHPRDDRGATALWIDRQRCVGKNNEFPSADPPESPTTAFSPKRCSRSLLKRGKPMNKRISVIVGVAALLMVGMAFGQERIMDDVVNKVIAKYQNSSCEQLWASKGQPQSEQQQRAVQFLHNDAAARTEFMNRVAGPIANKLFECGMIP
jgi:hypothetical protein